MDDSINESLTSRVTDEAFWEEIRSGYRLKPEMINLENGYYNIIPQKTLEKLIEHAREINYEGSYYMRTVQAERKAAVTSLLAGITGCQSGELAITRNATESLDTVISGFPWEKGDEAVMAEQDYPSMLSMFRQVSLRYGTVNRLVSVPLDPVSDEEIVDVYERAVTPRTRLIMVCHMINMTGQILPVRKICEMAHKRGIKVLVDGAHAVGHFQFTIPELGCDFYGSSLHKWLSVPLGAGLLWVSGANTDLIWPLLAPFEDNTEDIRRLNHTGTVPVYTDLTVEDSVNYYLELGPALKEARLRYLQHYWSDRAREMKHITLFTPSAPERSCAIATVGVKGLTPAGLADWLWEKRGIYTAPFDTAGVHGCRITPNVYTTTRELDALVDALHRLA